MSPAGRVCLEWFRRERTWINEQHLKLCRIPAPTFFEEKRAVWMAEQFQALGWEARLDRAGNVVANWPGARDASSMAVTAHLDTVLAPRTPEDIKMLRDGRMAGPGVADNGAGLAALLALAAAWKAAPPLEDSGAAPILVANVGEEGEGNLSGMRYFCRAAPGQPRVFLVLDGPGTDHITSRALASQRFEVTITGPGGHSWRDSAHGNPVHALSRAVTLFTDHAGSLNGTGAASGSALGLAPVPRSSFNFGIFEGGSSINSIPTEARAKIDLRSESLGRIDKMAELLTLAVDQAVEAENARGSGPRIAARIKEIGSRPSGELAENAPLLEAVRAVDTHLGIRSRLDCSSTDANIPLSLGLQAVSIGAGGQGGGAHTPAEWYLPEGRDLALRRILLAVCLLLTNE
ncbi:MAG TPA: M20/M25/M40 family metallo-hydrolase [Bryobacteraceae bacterium]|nr:M20/M25/M40 family metallo-hydrolase [Bryobacteraceae bacterium]